MMQRYALYCFFFFYSYIAVAHPVYKSIEFIENKGQWDGPFLYKGMTGNSDVYLEANGFTYVIGAGENPKLMHDVKLGRIPKADLRFYAYRVKFDGANINIPVTGSKPQEHYNNYFLGNDPDKWKTGIHPNLAVDYKNVYANIDLHVASEESEMKYDFIVYPGGNPEQIALKYEGVTKLRTKNKTLLVGTSLGDVEELAPYCYQYVDGEKKEIRCEYRVEGGKVSYYFPDGYNKSEILVIDPTVRFATFTGSPADNFGYTATYDAQTNFYAGGTVNANGYPGVTGFFQTTFAGGGSANGNNYFTDMAVTKFNTTGTARIYSTYIGGGENDQPHSMVVDANGNLVIVGRTYSANYPTQNPYDGIQNGGADIVVTKLNAAGTALIGSTFIGGSGDDGVNISALFGTFNTSLKHSYADDARSEVILDNAGNVYVAASTSSSDFPKANQSQASIAGGQDGVVFKLTSNLNSLTWSTYIGGSGDDACYVLALNASQSHVFVAGGTASSLFPKGTGGLWAGYQGNIDGFIVKFENSGSYTIAKGTFIGTTGYDQCFGVQVDAANNVYAVGNTLGGTFPVKSVVFVNPQSSQFIIKLDSNLATNIYSTVFGSGNSNSINITPVAFLVDTCQNVYISGWGGALTGAGGSTSNMPINLAGTTPANVLSNATDGNDFYFIVLEKNLQTATPLFGGYYGASTIGEHVDGGTSRFDRNGIIYQAICGGCGGSSAPPTTAGVVSNTNASTNCNLIAIKVEFNFGAVSAKAQASPNKVLCIGETVNFVNTSANAVSYEWDFGDGSGTNFTFQPSHAFTQVGTFIVRMIAINLNACRERDTITLTITVDTNTIDAAFLASIVDSCDPYSISILNSSKYGKNPGAASFLWDFGDGNTTTGATPGTHVYAKPGTYIVKLVMTDLTACNSPDSMTQTITFVENVDASFQVANICFGDTLFLANTSTNASNYLWKIGKSDTSTGVAPYYLPDSAGTFNIKLYAYNSVTCNKVDSVEKTVTINPKPTADFIYTPSELDIKANDSLVFTNKSILADSYNWNFGDGSGSQDFHTSHFYKKTGYYNVCLYSSNKGGCTDTICKKVYADILPLADIPTAFSPNGDGNNDILYIRGSAIQTVDLKIFNRWGEMVFHTTDVKIGWDGTHNGKPHEMDAFAYVLNVVFIDETTFYKKGNVTLLR